MFEILKATAPVCAIIREGKTFQLGSAMQIGRSQGMLTLDASLESLLAEGRITFDTAYAFAQKKELFTKGKAPKEAGQASAPAAEEVHNQPAVPIDVDSVVSAGPRAATGPLRPESVERPAVAAPAPLQPRPVQPPPQAQAAQAQPARQAAPPPAQPQARHAPQAQPATMPAQPQARPVPQAQPVPQQPPAQARPAPAAAPPGAPAAAAVPRKRISIPRDD